jgi:hypothetical protein
LFTDQEMRRVRALYYHAMANGLTLDYYAANNEFEYLAQAYPAYFSLTKIHPLNHKALATREDLIRKDPQLFGFIDSLVQRQQASLAGNATTLTSAWVMTYMTLSARARAQQNVSRALAYLDTAQVWDRNYIPVYQAYAAIYTELGEWDRAREWLDRASALGPGYAPLHQQRAEWTAARLQAGLLQEAEAVAQMAASYRQAISLETDFEMLASYNRALREMYAQAGYIREAIEVAEQYVAHAPLVSTYLRDERDEALAFAWGLKGRQGYGAGADTFFTDLIQRKPQVFRYRTLYAQVLLDQGRASAAVAELEPAYTLLTATGNQDATLISLLVQAYAGAGEMSRAQALAGELQQRYIRKTPEYLYAMLAVGQTAAVADGLKAIGEPTYGWDRAVYFHLRASLLEMTGQQAAAAEPLQAALTACAYYTPARLALIARSRRSEARKLRAAGQRLDFPPGPWLQQALRDNQ